MTPEGRVKKKIKELLDVQVKIWYDMPVPGGYGRSTLDYIGCHFGRAFAIEAKAPGKHPTSRQIGTIEDLEAAGAVVFVVDGQKGLDELSAWFTINQERHSP